MAPLIHCGRCRHLEVLRYHVYPEGTWTAGGFEDHGAVPIDLAAEAALVDQAGDGGGTAVPGS
jgi:hypothetical protein